MARIFLATRFFTLWGAESQLMIVMGESAYEGEWFESFVRDQLVRSIHERCPHEWSSPETEALEVRERLARFCRERCFGCYGGGASLREALVISRASSQACPGIAFDTTHPYTRSARWRRVPPWRSPARGYFPDPGGQPPPGQIAVGSPVETGRGADLSERWSFVLHEMWQRGSGATI